MAIDTQTFTAKSQVRTFRTLYQEPDRFRTAEPFGLLMHREPTGDDPVLDGSGVGDTPLFQLTFPLDQNYVYRLNTLHIQLISDDVGWKQGALNLFIQSSAPPNTSASSQIDLAMSRTFIASVTAGVETSSTFQLGGSASTDGLGHNVSSQFDRVPLLFGLPGIGTDPIFVVSTASTNVSAGTFTYYAEWLMFDLDQINNSGLYYQAPTVPL